MASNESESQARSGGLEMRDPDKSGRLVLPPPTVRSAAELLEHGPVTVLALPADPPAGPQDEEGVLGSGADASRPGSHFVMIPMAPPLPKEVEEVWHYTDASGVIGIVQSGTLRAASLITMNDSAEYKHGRDLLDSLMVDVRDSQYVHPLQKRYLERVVGLSDSLSRRPGLFAVSASEAGHSLSQWRAYGRGQPHALLIDPNMPLALVAKEATAYAVDTPNHSWRRVLYSHEEQADLLLSVLGYAAYGAPTVVGGVDGPETEHDRAVAMTLVSAIAYCKEPSFEVEREVRIIVRISDLGCVKFRPGATGVAPYVELTGTDSLAKRTEGSTRPLPIRGVVVGPFSARQESAEGVIVLLQATGHVDAWVGASTSTLR